MFSNLSKGSILHGVDRTGEMKWFTGSVERVTPSLRSTQYPTPFGQLPPIDLDIVVTIDGQQKEFRGIHSSDIIADFGKDSFILADNKDSLYNYVKSLLKTSEEIINEENIEAHKKLVPQYKAVLSEMMPGSSNAKEVKELKEQVSTLQAQLSEALSLLKNGSQKPS